MSLSSISSQLPRTAAEQAQRLEQQLRASTGFSTVTKVGTVFFAVIASLAAFTLGGAALGLVTAILFGIGLTPLFQGYLNPGTRYMNGYQDPNHNPGHPNVPGHVVVGGGHFPPGGGQPGHVPVGRGHFPPGGGQPGGHVHVGGGHIPGAPGAHPPHNHPPMHVAVGGGHGHGPTGAGNPPPPGGPGHVPVGRR